MAIFAVLIVVGFVVLGLLIAVCVLVGMGHIVSLLFPLALFHSTLLVLGTAFLAAFFIALSRIINAVNECAETLTQQLDDEDEDDEDEDDDWEDDEDDWDDEEEQEEDRDSKKEAKGPEGSLRLVQKVGRNSPCPCGSGLKYKKCCGKQ